MVQDRSRGRDYRRVLSLAGALFLGAVLVVASIGKVADPIVFVEQIREEGLDFLFSANTVALIALTAETVLGLALLLGVRHLLVLVPTSALVAFFVFLTGRSYWMVVTGQRADSYDCGCFGVFLQRTATEAFWQDLFLLVPPLILAFLYRPALRRRFPAWKAAVSGAGTAVLVGYLVLGIGLPEVAAPQLATAGEGLTAYRLSNSFELVVDGRADRSGRIFEADVTLQFLLESPSLEKPLLLDVRTSKVYELEHLPVHSPDAAEFEAPVELTGRDLGSFEVGVEGLSFLYGDRTILVRNRS